MVLSGTKQGMKWCATALWLSAVACTPAYSPQAPATGKLSILNPAGLPDVAEAAEQPGAAALEIIPGRVRSNYISKSEAAAAAVDRGPGGWHLQLSAPAAKTGEKPEFAGYCWEITECNAMRFNTLALDLSLVTQQAEIQVRLEQKDASIQEGKLVYLTQGILMVDLANYPLVSPALARLCLIASGSADTPAATSADFVLRRAILQ